MFVLKGLCVDVERFHGVSKRTGNEYDMTRYYILVGRSVFPCSLDDDWPGPAPEKDQQVSAEFRPSTFADNNGNARLDVRLLRPVEVHVKPVEVKPAQPAPGPRSVAG